MLLFWFVNTMVFIYFYMLKDTLLGFWTCTAAEVECVDPTSAYCISPDVTKASCVQGNGDCGAY
jgi:hypothetical protein